MAGRAVGDSSLVVEWRWAVRGIRARGGAAVFQSGLVGVTLAACVLAFVAADAFVFRPVDYPHADRLVVFERSTVIGVSDYITPAEIDAWRQQTDIFADVRAHDGAGTLHVAVGDATDLIQTHVIAPGLLELLGVVPRWGRPFTADDAVAGAEPVVIIGESLARRVFGDPASAIDGRLPASENPPRIVGVMPASFHFPSAAQQVWWPLVDEEPTPGRPGIRNRRALALVAPDQRMEQALAAIPGRLPATQAGLPAFVRGEATTPRTFVDTRRDPRALLFRMLLGASFCLLLIACLNVASLELATSVRRARSIAVQSVLGATQRSLARVAALEAALLTATASLVALLLCWWGVASLPSLLPVSMRDSLVNALDLDRRAFTFLAGAVVATWFVLAIPAVWRVTRLHASAVLRSVTRTSTVSRRQALTRHALMTAQVALTVTLLVGSLLFVRSYAARVSEDKGFDATNLVGIELLVPAEMFRSARLPHIESDVIGRLHAHPAVRSASRTGQLPPQMTGGVGGVLQVHGRDGNEGEVKAAGYSVDPEYFDTLGIRLQQGRWFTSSDPAGTVVVDEAFARRHWPEGDALGARFNIGATMMGGAGVFTIVGVASHVRGDSVETPTGAPVHVVYLPLGSTYNPLRFVARLRSIDDAVAVADAVRQTADVGVVRLTPIEERYARLYADTRMAAAITSTFGIMAFLVALAGTYAVVAFLVAGRTREIGIRLAIGASGRRVLALVLGPALMFIGLGTILGLGAALAASRSIESHLFGVTADDPSTYVSVAAAVIVMAIVSTWWPARRASRIDPAITLRAE